MVNYISVKTVPDSTKLRQKKGPKSKIPRPRTPLVCHMLCTQIHTCPSPPSTTHTISFCPLGQKAERNPVWHECCLHFAGHSHALTLKCILLSIAVYAPSYAKPHLLCFVQNKAGPSSKIAGTDPDKGRCCLYNRFCTII